MNFQLYKLSTKEVFRLSSVSYCLPERAILNPVARWQMSCKVESMSPLEKVPNHIFYLCNLLTINGTFS